jgi:hypothetical protein
LEGDTHAEVEEASEATSKRLSENLGVIVQFDIYERIGIMMTTGEEPKGFGELFK